MILEQQLVGVSILLISTLTLVDILVQARIEHLVILRVMDVMAHLTETA